MFGASNTSGFQMLVMSMLPPEVKAKLQEVITPELVDDFVNLVKALREHRDYGDRLDRLERAIGTGAGGLLPGPVALQPGADPGPDGDGPAGMGDGTSVGDDADRRSGVPGASRRKAHGNG